MGRPPRPAAERQSKRVLVSMTPADFRRLKAEAKARNLPLATVLLRTWQQSKRE